MKSKALNIFAILMTAAILFVACTKEDKDVRLDPILSTSETTNITNTSANVIGFITSHGSGFTEKGVCYSLTATPTIETATKVVCLVDTITATFEVKLTGLDFATKYYARAYAISPSGIMYGEEITFTTLPNVPTVTTAAFISNTSKTANGGGSVTDDGRGTITKRGVCYSVLPNPTLEHCKDSITDDGKGLGAFTSALSNLTAKTKYYVRAYATNSGGTGYGPEVSFTTIIDLPTITTTDISNITSDGKASSGGNITYDGGASITERGICWSTSANPSIADNKTSDGNGSGKFTSLLTGLAVSTTYHVRAYAINSVGVAYGSDIQFSTYPTSLYMIGDGIISDASHQWDWSVDLPMIPVNGQPNLFWKIVWMNGSGGFKMNSAKAWNGNEFGKTGNATNGVFNKGGDNIPVPVTAGYYMVVVDFATGKIAIADPKVYLMGETIGSWNTENAAGLFTVDNANSVITVTKPLDAKELRMYAWHPWFTDWWRSEFIILGGKIEFRGNGGDQSRVTVSAGTNKIDLNFKTGDGSIAVLP